MATSDMVFKTTCHYMSKETQEQKQIVFVRSVIKVIFRPCLQYSVLKTKVILEYNVMKECQEDKNSKQHHNWGQVCQK